MVNCFAENALDFGLKRNLTGFSIDNYYIINNLHLFLR